MWHFRLTRPMPPKKRALNSPGEFLFPKAATGQVMSAKSVSKQLGKHVGEPVKRGEQTLLLRKTADTHAKILSYSVEVR